MRVKKANIDSLNLADEHFISLFISNEDYSIEAVKSRTIFNPNEWFNTFGKSLTRNITEASIIHTYLGLSLALKTYSRSQKVQVLEFAGLHSYNERSKLLNVHLKELWSQLQHTRLSRIDIAIDWEKIPSKVFKALQANREPFKWFNSTYFKTAKEGKKNYYINIIAYDKVEKARKAGITFPLDKLERLEFSFNGAFFKDMYLKDLPKATKKMEKAIKKKIGITVKILPL